MQQSNNSYSSDYSAEIALNRDLHKHEQTKLKEQHNYDLSKQEQENNHVQNLEKTKLGKVGQLFGTGENASKNIAATVCILILIGGASVSLYAYIAKGDSEFASSMWNVMSPIITLALGYLFGKN